MRNIPCVCYCILSLLILTSCIKPESIEPKVVLQQQQSPLVMLPANIPEPWVVLPTVTPEISNPISDTTTVINPQFTDAAYIGQMNWQDDGLVTGFSEGQPQDHLKFFATTEIWERTRIGVNDLQIGDYVSVFGTNRGDGYAYTDYIAVLIDPSDNFDTIGEYTQGHIITGTIASITGEGNDVVAVIQSNEEQLVIQLTRHTRVFSQKRVSLQGIERDSFVAYRGRLLQDETGILIEIRQALILSKPSQFSMTQFSLACDRSNGRTLCRDDFLDIEFEPPEDWGEGTAVLIPSQFFGYSYGYHFQNGGVVAGGRSSDFMEPRGGFITDFGGFGEQSIAQVCARFSGSLCEEIRPGVISIIRVPEASWICSPGPGVFFKPEVIIAVDLPDHATINGMLFVFELVPESLALLTTSMQPSPYLLYPETCDEEGQLRFNQQMKLFIEQIQQGSVDAAIMENLQKLRNFGASFQGASLPGE